MADRGGTFVPPLCPRHEARRTPREKLDSQVDVWKRSDEPSFFRYMLRQQIESEREQVTSGLANVKTVASYITMSRQMLEGPKPIEPRKLTTCQRIRRHFDAEARYMLRYKIAQLICPTDDEW